MSFNLTNVDQITGAATRLCVQKGFARLSIRSVARECKVSRSAIYYHVDSVESLRALVVREAFRSANCAVISQALAAADPTALAALAAGDCQARLALQQQIAVLKEMLA